MEKVRQLTALTVAAVLAVLGAGWFLLVSPQRHKVTDLESQAAQARSKAGTLQTQIDRLKAEAKELPGVQAQLAQISTKLPNNPAMPVLVHQLTTAAAAAGVDLQVIAPGPPSAVTSTATTAKLPPTTAGSKASKAGAAASGASAASAGTLMQMPVQLTVAGTYFQIAQFLANLEKLPRSFVVNQISIAPGNSMEQQKASADGAKTAGAAPAATGGNNYDGQLTAQLNGAVFELTNATSLPDVSTLPATTGSATGSTLPSGSASPAPASGK